LAADNKQQASNNSNGLVMTGKWICESASEELAGYQCQTKEAVMEQ
jgi:hypothetical protein